MFRTASAACFRTVSHAKPFCSEKTALAKEGLSDGPGLNPTVWLPRLCVSCRCPTHKVPVRGTNPPAFHSTSPHRSRRSSIMASTKEYRLLCLENPLLGKPTKFFFSFVLNWAPRDELSSPLSSASRPSLYAPHFGAQEVSESSGRLTCNYLVRHPGLRQ